MTPTATADEPRGDAGAVLALQHIGMRYGAAAEGLSPLLRRLGLAAPAAEVHAVRDVSLSLQPGEVVGLVGESGCGKSTLGRIAAGIHAPTEGRLLFKGRDPARAAPAERRAFDLGVQMVFQNPFASLNPRLRVGEAIGEAARVHGLVTRADQSAYVAQLMRQVGLDPSFAGRYPHQFSGGQRQRIVIARALAVRPEVLVCDEATAALDVSVQAQVLNLFMRLRAELELSCLFISHNLAVVEYVADRVLIMYLGRIVESATAEELFARPAHPYTQALMNEVPQLHGGRRNFVPIKGELPSPLAPPSGCAFHPRCPHAMAQCVEVSPALRQIGADHMSACHLN